MKKTIRHIVSFLSAVLLFFVFNSLEYDLLLMGFSKDLQSAIFAITVGFLILKPTYSFTVMISSCILFAAMVVLYMFDLLAISNYLGSIGLGVLTISSIFHFKNLLSNSGNN